MTSHKANNEEQTDLASFFIGLRLMLWVGVAVKCLSIKYAWS